MVRRYLNLSLVVFMLVSVFGKPGLAEDRLVIAVASNFLLPLKTLQERFEASSAINLQIVSGSTGKLYAQILQGAPFDVFLAADKHSVLQLIESGTVGQGNTFLYARGQLAFWAPGSQRPDYDLKQRHFSRLVIANPKLAPYGLAAMEVLKALNLAEEYSSKLIVVENVAQAFQHIFHESVRVGFVAMTQLKSKDITDGVWQLPANYHSPIEQYGAVLQSHVKSANAEEFVKFLTHHETRSILVSKFGYAPFDSL